MTEKEKMLAGELYNATGKELTEERLVARSLMHKINHSLPEEDHKRQKWFAELFGTMGKNVWIEPPFYCDYGYNIKLGKNIFINFNCCMLDVVPISIGDHTFIAPNVQFYAATHPVDAERRSALLEYGKPITIGEHVWIGGNVTICPGVTIGDRSVIGAGSVVTKDIPDDVVVGGNPARIIRSIDNSKPTE